MLERIFDSIAKMELTTDFGRENVQVWLLSYAPVHAIQYELTVITFFSLLRGIFFTRPLYKVGWASKGAGSLSPGKEDGLSYQATPCIILKTKTTAIPLDFFRSKGWRCRYPAKAKAKARLPNYSNSYPIHQQALCVCCAIPVFPRARRMEKEKEKEVVSLSNRCEIVRGKAFLVGGTKRYFWKHPLQRMLNNGFEKSRHPWISSGKNSTNHWDTPLCH